MSFNCTDLVGSELDMCNYMNTPTGPTCNGVLYYTVTDSDTGVTECFNYSSSIAKAAALLGNDAYIDTGNNAFMMTAAALVMIMTPGVGLFYAGLAGEETASNTLMMSFVTMCIVTVQWWLFGYSFAFGPGTAGFGSFQWGALYGVGANPSGVYGFNIPHLTWVAFQLMFAIITPALISGAVVGRMKFSAYCVFCFIWTTVVYDPLAHWVWSFQLTPEGTLVAQGWLGVLGSLDFAGGGVIHISSGFAALACALVLGKRSTYGEEVKPHNVPLVVIGGSLLWFGWFGFNAGSAGGAANTNGVWYAADGSILKYNDLASVAFLNTHLAAASGSLTWMVVDKLYLKKITVVGAMAGAVAGLVAITPAAGFVDVWTSLIFGLVVSPICYFAGKFKTLIGVDDTLDSFALHGVGGMVGAFMTGLFATKGVNGFDGAFYGNNMLLAYNCAAIATCASFSFVLTLLIMLILKYTIGVRVDEQAEKEGIDVSEHGGKTYAH
jgi:Amt family ammonium transporter